MSALPETVTVPTELVIEIAAEMMRVSSQLHRLSDTENKTGQELDAAAWLLLHAAAGLDPDIGSEASNRLEHPLFVAAWAEMHERCAVELSELAVDYAERAARDRRYGASIKAGGNIEAVTVA